MPRYAQIVMGPAGSGKSTYCSTMKKHYATLKKNVHVVNLDPAAEVFDYEVMADIRDLISLEDAMDDDSLKFGPNGGLVFCMEYFAQNFDWLDEALDDIEDDYILFDCPGQIELYTHIPVMRQLVDHLQAQNFRLCGIFIMDSQFMTEAAKFVSGIMTALSAMVNLEIAHVNVMSKLDLLNKAAKKEIEKYLEPDLPELVASELAEDPRLNSKFKNLSHAIAGMIEDYSLVKFHPMDLSDENTLSDLQLTIDNAIQYGEDAEPKEAKDYDGGIKDPDDIIERFSHEMNFDNNNDDDD